MKHILLLLFFFSSYVGFAQGEANNWYFGRRAGIKFNADGSVSPLTDGRLTTNEGCSSISDAQGNLLFYTDGRNVWDKNGNKMPNADYENHTGLMGDPSSTQSAIIVPKKGQPNIYYIFTVDEPHHDNATTYPNQFLGPYSDNGTIPADDDGYNNGLNYSVVDLSVTGDSEGDVVTRNVHLQTYVPGNFDQEKYKCSEKITAVKTADGSGFWVITHFVDNFYAFKVDASGVNHTPVISNQIPEIPTQGYRRNAIGYLKASPNGKKLAIAHQQIGMQEGQAVENGVVYLYDFDAATGQVTNPVMISENMNPYGVEFSRETKKLYVSYSNGGNGLNGVVQYNLLAPSIPASAVRVSFSNTASGALQLGPNGKIYRAVNGQVGLDVIQNPEADGTACNYTLFGQASGGVGTLGLPPFITSLLSASIIATNNCVGQPATISLASTDVFDSVVWDFGDGSPTSADVAPVHTYTAAGTYTVTATITKDGDVTVVSAPITVSVIPIANPAPALVACDGDNNGTENFDLTVNSAAIRGMQSLNDFEVKFYRSQADADADTNALPATNYESSAPAETIYARIHNKANPNCYAVTWFGISVTAMPNVTTTAFSVCDDNTDGDDTNGQAIFDIATVANTVISNLSDFTYAFYENLTDATSQVSPLPAQYYNTLPFQQDVYIRLQSIASPGCSIVYAITLGVHALPVQNGPVTLVQCEAGTTPDGLTQFNLAQANQQLTGGNVGLIVKYYLNDVAAQSGTGELPLTYTNITNPQQIVARVESAQTGCFRTVPVTLQVNHSALPIVDLEACDEDANGNDNRTLFNLDDSGLATGTNTVAYYLTENDALLEQNPIPAAYTNTAQNQVIYARIENGNDCIGIQQVRLIVRRLPDIDPTGEGVICLNTASSIIITSGLTGSTAGYSFLWNTGVTTPTLQVNQPGTYTVTVQDLSNTAGCSRTRTVTVTASNVATITDVEIHDLIQNNTVIVHAVAPPPATTTYLYSLDAPNGPYQASNVFENVSVGFHTVYVYDEKGCGVSKKDITVLGIPKFFTPNGDGINETWNIIGVNALFYKNSKIYVYDRFGKLLSDVDPRGLGWDGTYNGQKLPATDYWYLVELDNGRTVKGHFSLIR